MTSDEAGFLARRIVNTFRSTAALPEWVDALLPLDVAAASVTVTKLRDEIESGGLLIGRFQSRYREVRSAARGRQTGPGCGTCDGTHYVTCADERRHGPGCRRDGLCTCHAVVPCPACSVGHPTPVREEPPVSLEDYLSRLCGRVERGELSSDALSVWQPGSGRTLNPLPGLGRT